MPHTVLTASSRSCRSTVQTQRSNGRANTVRITQYLTNPYLTLFNVDPQSQYEYLTSEESDILMTDSEENEDAQVSLENLPTTDTEEERRCFFFF